MHWQFGQDLAAIEASDPGFGSAVAAAVPEPGGVALLGLASSMLLRRRREEIVEIGK
jgi:hypothetical protein